jgi:hypothetical protein
MTLTGLKVCLVAVALIGGQAACSRPLTPAANLLGLNIGMDRVAARAQLTSISEFVRDEGRNQEVWKLNDSSRFSAVAVGFREDKLKYVTAFVDKDAAREHVAFSSVGDLVKARAEIMAPHYRYTWDYPANGERAASSAIAYGDNPNFLTMYTIVEKRDVNDTSGSEGEEEDDD